jgi:hypothetical protein
VKCKRHWIAFVGRSVTSHASHTLIEGYNYEIHIVKRSLDLLTILVCEIMGSQALLAAPTDTPDTPYRISTHPDYAWRDGRHFLN